MKAFLLLAVCLAVLTACGSKTSPPAPGSGEVAFVPLSGEQIAIVEAGMREMIGGPLPSELRAVRGVTFPGKPGIHVCGTFKDKSVEYPFYIELGDKDGVQAATRGQIGSDPGKKAKVTFMCRHHR